MSIAVNIFAVYEDDPVVVDCRIDIVAPMCNGAQYFSTSLLVDRAGLPASYTWDDLAAACTTLIDTSGITVTHD